MGATPLLAAAEANGTLAVVSLLLDKGADVNAGDTRGVTPLIAAATVGNTSVAKLLLQRGADPAAYAAVPGPKMATPLMGAVQSGDVELTRFLLALKPNINMTAPDNDGKVKNGVVALGSFTALHLATTAPSPEVAKLLLDSGASVNASDVRGFTPLMWAIGTDHPDLRIIRLLLDHGADASIASKDGETARDWARKFNDAKVLSVLKLQTKEISVNATPAPAKPRTAREAVERSLPLLRTGSSGVMKDGGCVACHGQPMTGLATEYASQRGWSSEPATTDTSQVAQALMNSTALFLSGYESGGMPDTNLYEAFMMATLHMPPSVSTDSLVYYLAAKQRESGNWHGLRTRAPIQDNDITRTAMAVRILAFYGMPARKADIAARIQRAATWLAAQVPVNTEDRDMQLLGLSWAKADQSGRDKRLQELVTLQHADGGWGQTQYLASDAYATGQVLVTLREMGVPASNASIQKGVGFLLRTQAEDGSWHVKSRSLKIQPYFQSGFPYEHDQWISQSGTAWAVMGLSTATQGDSRRD
jgi:hypothetical protein